MARNKIENHLESIIEGFFARIFKSGLRPVEIGKRILRVIDSNRSVGVDGKLIAPNYFIIKLSPDDNKKFLEIQKTLRHDLVETIKQYSKKEGYKFIGTIHIEFETDNDRLIGTFDIIAAMREDQKNSTGFLKNDLGQITYLLNQVTTLGRHPGCDVVLQEKAASRHHAEIHKRNNGVFFIDKNSTNGTYINDQQISEHQLVDNDQIRIGNTTFSFNIYE
ncbi:MAG TPA: DUF3662 and FHA domain-containing protein [Acidimicrobiales bacterium]|nr:DUF3662 and FHA domain-containing protein [Acidimicrobiales bacterium]|tara:strand:- start:10439 stop:11098 length:660 start_codon:yes stop_codon:yes gene_type:complete